ncbi:maleylacetate reductase [Ascodesmis nigricans]|uniref:Maleylacetate reductase n=1 Tax=Ascodesmis nigricans TaxID=341454 RepID=A0A4S2MT15_9PEZI|nr:maleylacetate reductase [Ascodesmis nigricans]
MEPFVYTVNPSRVVFGSGTLKQLPRELQRLSLTSPLILCTPQQTSQANAVASLLRDASIAPAGLFEKATMHTPTNVTAEAQSQLASLAADSLISIGGGSTIGLGKALSIRTGLHHICIPTTYAGSEMTPILGETEDGRKTTRSDPKILPGTVIYDVDLTMTLPTGMSATSGVNAIAHAVEAAYAVNRNPITTLLAVEGIRALAESLPVIVKDTANREAREKALYGAWLCGACLGTVGMSLHHKLCHTLGGSFNLPHAQTHTIVLPHALAYNLPSLSEEVRLKLGRAFPGADGDAVKGLNELLEKLGVERSLKAYGLKEEDVERASEIAMEREYPNPRKLVKEEIREVIRRAWAGEPARADL